MAEHQALEGQFSTITYFGSCKPKFEPVKEDQQLEIMTFLEASRQILPFLETLGKAFVFVKKDVQGNIEKIEKHRAKDPEKYKTINIIVEEDQSAEKKEMSDGCVGVLWLKRGLDFIHNIFAELLADLKNEVTDENISPTIGRAYENSIKKYHGWMTQKVIGGVIKMVPYRKDFLERLMLEPSATPELVLKDIELYDVNLAATVKLMDDLLTKNNKNSEEKV
ncbi:glycolipid transfer protein-like [Littorina saxatilis]|uniref:Glycolipid transfer protein domain-containing protein n=1 Tax=Littorina saxatilis TaxID=31220 RepID=A0AAN9AIS1_9CAEN